MIRTDQTRYRGDYGGSKSEFMRVTMEAALAEGKRVGVATTRQKFMLDRLRVWFPNAVFVIEGEWFIRVVPR